MYVIKNVSCNSNVKLFTYITTVIFLAKMIVFINIAFYLSNIKNVYYIFLEKCSFIYIYNKMFFKNFILF